jgi:molybdenum cofactor cytidylyltransferase
MGNDKRMPYALIPAAGKSRRMGRPKVSLTLGGRTVLEHVIAALQKAGVADILVVLGPQVAELAPLVERAGARVLLPAEQTHTMRATVEQGLTWLENRFHPRPRESWFLVPADYPILEPEIVQKLLRKRRGNRKHSIFIPTYQGRRGHPALIAWKHVAAIRSLPPEIGLNVFLRSLPKQTLEVPMESPTILWDLDTPEDYQRILAVWDECKE